MVWIFVPYMFMFLKVQLQFQIPSRLQLQSPKVEGIFGGMVVDRNPQVWWRFVGYGAMINQD